MSSRLPHATVSDILLVNKLVANLRATAQQKNLIWGFPCEKVHFVVMSDVGGVGTSDRTISQDGMLTDGAQGAY
eukprot:13507147-Alexandrium_andersonii.AAC.1